MKINPEITLTGSKSISNRLLILNALYNNKINLKNVSNSEDTTLLNKALKSDNQLIDIHHAGTAMRFLTSFYAFGKDIKTLTGSQRMKQRPIGILVETLNKIGAKIEYLENEGFPPIKILPSDLTLNKVQIPAGISSQFITSILLIASKFENPFEVELIGKITSLPYLKMTLEMMNQIGIKSEIKENIIKIYPEKDIENQDFIIESDWSSASYHYSFCAISDNPQTKIKINYLFENSLQGDRKVADIYQKYFGINTEFLENNVILTKIPNFKFPDFIEINLNDCPDIAQTIAVTCSALKIKAKLTGLETLKIKESDRIVALHNELKKCGTQTEISDSTLEIKSFFEFDSKPIIKTYNDHRMAMSFAPFRLLFDLEIENPEVVEKSYPDFWKDINK